ncbi:TPA: HD domain-containing protein, partial [Candidatus Poribacteria bacterium]|nr:HD domain-containing protein [Candidatus Poribacteria bacterium]
MLYLTIGEDLPKIVMGYNSKATRCDMVEPERLQKLLEISRSLNSEVELERLMWKIVPFVREMLGADRGSVFLLDEDRGELWSLVAEGEEIKEIRFSADKGIAGYVARTGRTVNIPDAYSDPRFNREVDRRTGYRTKSILCSPMKNLQGDVIGVVQILNKLDGDAFTKDDEILLEAFTAQAAIAVENALLYAELEETYEQTLQALVALLDRRDVETENHSVRVVEYTLLIARKLGFHGRSLRSIKWGALLHDIGKIGIEDRILHKPDELTPEEWEIIKAHPIIGYEALKHIKFLSDALPIVLHHHERYDGKGYPDGLRGNEIPIGARIFAIADAFDAMTSDRPYRRAMPVEKALWEIATCSGTQFDPNIVGIFLQIPIESLLSIPAHIGIWIS